MKFELENINDCPICGAKLKKYKLATTKYFNTLSNIKKYCDKVIEFENSYKQYEFLLCEDSYLLIFNKIYIKYDSNEFVLSTLKVNEDCRYWYDPNIKLNPKDAYNLPKIIDTVKKYILFS